MSLRTIFKCRVTSVELQVGKVIPMIFYFWFHSSISVNQSITQSMSHSIIHFHQLIIVQSIPLVIFISPIFLLLGTLLSNRFKVTVNIDEL